VGRAAVQALTARDIKVNVVESAPSVAAGLSGMAHQVIVGDAADRAVLTQAGIESAPSILLTTHDDAMNIYLTVYCRRLNPEARILSRVTHERNVEAIQRAGADFVLSYASLGVQGVLAIVQGREPVVLAEGVDLFHIPVPRTLVRRTLAEARINERTGLNVIGVQRDEQVLTTAAADLRLEAGGSLLAIGSAIERERFRQTFA
jgi:Trk K+ transport system NAD-binding subunit